MPEDDKIILVFSGLCHDVAHTGHTNAFEVNSLSKLAVRYNDKSVLIFLILTLYYIFLILFFLLGFRKFSSHYHF